MNHSIVIEQPNIVWIILIRFACKFKTDINNYQKKYIFISTEQQIIKYF